MKLFYHTFKKIKLKSDKNGIKISSTHNPLIKSFKNDNDRSYVFE